MRIDLQELRRTAAQGHTADLPLAAEATSDDVLVTARELLLLQQTLEIAQLNVPYYRRLFADASFSPADFQTAADLRAVPILTRPAVVNHLEELIDPESHITSITSTSGTTSAVRLPRLIGRQEQEACALLRQISAGASRASHRDIVLRVVPVMRRYIGADPYQDALQILVNLSLHYPRFTVRLGYDDFVVRQLFERMPIPRTAGRVTIIHATPPFLIRIITDELEARHLSPHDTGVRAIACSGGLVTSRIRTMVEQQWRVPLTTSYSLSEINGVAVECPQVTNRYHWDASVYAETVDTETHEPVDEGDEGTLLVTALHPFQQAQPFIRYNTGDLVRYVGRQCTCGFLGASFEYLGRTEQCIDLKDIVGARGTRFVSPTAIHNVLEDIDEVPSLLYPKFDLKRINRDPADVAVQLTVEVSHVVNESWAEMVCARILKKLHEHYKEWRAFVEDGRLTWHVRVCNKGELSSFVKLYPDS